MAVTFDQFFAAIAQQESGGDYGAVNARTGASGKYQIMPANIGPWSRQYLGRTVSVSEFRRSPQIQEQLARAVLGDYFGKYGARGAAAAWYSGDPGKADNYRRFRSNEPSIGEYVDSVLKRAGSAEPDEAPAPTQPASPVGNEPASDPLAPAALQQVTAPVAPGSEAADMPGANAADQPVQVPQSTPFLPDMDEQTFGQVFSGGAATGRAADIIAEARKYLGTPYRWGGTSPLGFDCSGLLQYVFRKHGIELPRVSFAQMNTGKRVGASEAAAGDLWGIDNSSRNNGVDHIALYLGDGQILEAPRAGLDVRIRKLSDQELSSGKFSRVL